MADTKSGSIVMLPLSDVSNTWSPCRAGPSSQITGWRQASPEQYAISKEITAGCSAESARQAAHDPQSSLSEVETASQSGSEWLSATDSSASDDGNEGEQTLHQAGSFPRHRRQSRRSDVSVKVARHDMAPVYFGTPSKEEFEKRDKHNDRMRTRRILRKDSIELARRKSGGSTASRCSYPGTSSSAGREQPFYSAAMSPQSSDRANQSLDGKDADTVLPSTEEVSGLLATVEKPRAPLFDISPAGDVTDPDATEEADWFGRSSDIARRSSPAPSPPSTPTRKQGHVVPDLLAAKTQTPSEADSSPGIALARENFCRSRSPIQTTSRASAFAPFAASPLAYQAKMSPISKEDRGEEKENIASSSAVQSPTKSKVLQDSPSKLNSARSPWQMSPTKADLRVKLAAWADSRILSPSRPEKTSNSTMEEMRLLSPTPTSISDRHTDIDVQQWRTAEEGRNNQAIVKHSHSSLEPKRISKLPMPTSKLPRPIKRELPIDPTCSRLSRQQTLLGDRTTYKQAQDGQHGVGSMGPFKRNLISNHSHTRLVSRPRISLTSPPGARQTAASKQKTIVMRSAKHLLGGNASTAQSSDSSSTSLPKAPARPFIRDARLIPGRIEAGTDNNSDVGPPPGSSERDPNSQEEDSVVTEKQASSIGVGGARRVLVACAGTPASLAKREHVSLLSEVRGTPLSRDLSAARSRPMRRINDYIKSQGSSSPRENQVSSETAANEYAQYTKATTALYPTLSPKRVDHPPNRRTNPARTSKSKPAPPPLPMSNAELSKLTSTNTRINETSTVEKDVLVIRRPGENRPPSPSSRFRKDAHSLGEIIAGPRSGPRFYGDEAHRMPGGISSRHALGAGDEEPYTSPLRRITLKKNVKWHTALFVGPSDATVANEFGTLRELEQRRLDRNLSSCLRGQNVPLDRFGNYKPASKALPPQKPMRIQVTKIIYDDDEDASDSS